MRSAAAASRRPRPGRVVSAGHAPPAAAAKASGSTLDAPARLVLAESYNRGRRATCDGQDLGTPEVGGLYGTAWRVPKTCTNVTITFAPTALVNAGYALSLLVGLLLLALSCSAARRGRPRAARGRRPRAGARACRRAARR